VASIAQGTSNYLGAAVVAIKARFGNDDSMTASHVPSKSVRPISTSIVQDDAKS
jgi:hypothetical protein